MKSKETRKIIDFVKFGYPVRSFILTSDMGFNLIDMKLAQVASIVLVNRKNEFTKAIRV